MDIVHHALIGGAGLIALSANEHELAGMAFVVGSVFPDLDVALMALGKRFYLRNHQGPTHSFLLSPLYALLVVSPAIIYIGFEWLVYLAALAGLWLHVLLDLTNTFGITLFWPVRRGRRCLDSVFFIDSVTWSLTAAFYLQTLWFPIPAAVYSYAGLFALYLIFKFLLHKRVMRDLACAYAVPGSLNPFTFFILLLDDASVKVLTYNAWSRKAHHEKSYGIPDRKWIELAEKSELFRDMRQITRHLFITNVNVDKDGSTIIAHDIGVRNFGGRFGKTVLKFDNNGELVDEMAYI